MPHSVTEPGALQHPRQGWLEQGEGGVCAAEGHPISLCAWCVCVLAGGGGILRRDTSMGQQGQNTCGITGHTGPGREQHQIPGRGPSLWGEPAPTCLGGTHTMKCIALAQHTLPQALSCPITLCLRHCTAQSHGASSTAVPSDIVPRASVCPVTIGPGASCTALSSRTVPQARLCPVTLCLGQSVVSFAMLTPSA